MMSRNSSNPSKTSAIKENKMKKMLFWIGSQIHHDWVGGCYACLFVLVPTCVVQNVLFWLFPVGH